MQPYRLVAAYLSHAGMFICVESTTPKGALADVMDRINRRFGRDAVYPGAMLGAETSAPTRISFTQIPKLDEF